MMVLTSFYCVTNYNCSAYLFDLNKLLYKKKTNLRLVTKLEPLSVVEYVILWLMSNSTYTDSVDCAKISYVYLLFKIFIASRHEILDKLFLSNQCLVIPM